jgi:WD40 repeat protein
LILGSLGNTCATISSDGAFVAFGRDRRVQIHDGHTGGRLAEFRPHESETAALEFSPDSQMLIAATTMGHVFVYRLKIGREPQVDDVEHIISIGAAQEIEFANSNNVWWLGSETGSVSVFQSNEDSTSQLETIRFGMSPSFKGIMATSPSAHWVGIAREDAVVELISSKRVAAYQRAATQELGTWISLSPDGNLLAVAYEGAPYFDLWDAHTLSKISRLGGHKKAISALAFTDGGERLISLDINGDVVLWDVARRSIKASLATHVSTPISLALIPSDDRFLIGGVNGEIRICQFGTTESKTLSTIHGAVPISGLAVAPSADLAVSAGWDRRLIWWSLAHDRKPLGVLMHRAPIVRLAWSPDGSFLASVGPEDAVNLWDPKRMSLLASLPSAAIDGHALTFSPDSKTLVTSHFMEKNTTQASIELWSVAIRRSAMRLPAPPSIVWKSLEFSRDGERLFAPGGTPGDFGIVVWHAPRDIDVDKTCMSNMKISSP